MPDGYHRFASTFTGRSKLKTPTGSSVSLQIAEYSFQRHIHASNLDTISAAHPLPSSEQILGIEHSPVGLSTNSWG
jgi:hypothetical protein